MVSVNTNIGAMVALRQLGATNQGLRQTQSRINTGLEVASARDNGAVFSIAQSMRAENIGYASVIGTLDKAISTMDVTLAAAHAISDILVELKHSVLGAADQSITAEQREAYGADFVVLRDQYISIVENAEFNGVNLLDGSMTTPFAVMSSPDGNQTIDITSRDLRPTTLYVYEHDPSITHTEGGGEILLSGEPFDLQSLDDPDVARIVIDDLEDSISNLSNILAYFGTSAKALETHKDFVTKISDTLSAGIGNLVDADIAKESARLQAFQTKQQLGAQALSIANAAPQIALSLFN